MALPKIEDLADLLRSRLADGGYALRDIPSERKLAQELGVSRAALRAAIERMEGEGLVERGETGRLRPARPAEGRIAFLAPGSASRSFENLYIPTRRAADAEGTPLRSVYYSSQDDPLIQETLRAYDGVFFAPDARFMNDRLLALLREHRSALVVYDYDLSQSGIRCIVPYPARHIRELVLRAAARPGAGRIDCVTTFSDSPFFQERVGQWSLALHEAGRDGEILRVPRGDGTRIEEAVMRALSAHVEGRGLPDSIFCTCEQSALAALRLLADRGIAVPGKCGVARLSDQGLARYTIPRLAALEIADVADLAALSIRAMRDASIVLPLRLESPVPALFEGESL